MMGLLKWFRKTEPAKAAKKPTISIMHEIWETTCRNVARDPEQYALLMSVRPTNEEFGAAVKMPSHVLHEWLVSRIRPHLNRIDNPGKSA
jgi:hypothetical protein